MSARCSACDAPIRFVAMAGSGKQNPLNAEPCVDGNVKIQTDGLARVVPRLERDALRASGVPLFKSHFADCVAARSFRSG